MKLKDILAISGKPGLYQYLSQGRNGIIVEGFATKKKLAINAATKVSSLEDIAIYTETDEVPLREVLKSFFEKEEGKATIPSKSGNDQLKAKFEEILPTYDKDRVYVSDIKKIISWYNTLIEFDLLNAEILEEDKDDAEAEIKEEPGKGTEE